MYPLLYRQVVSYTSIGVGSFAFFRRESPLCMPSPPFPVRPVHSHAGSEGEGGGDKAAPGDSSSLRELRGEIERLREMVEHDERRALVRTMFHFEASAPGEEATAKRRGLGDKIAGACDSLWGGPVAPYDDDTILSWVSTFCNGVTTAHGINRVFDDGQGPLRRVFWLLFFVSSFGVLWYLVNNAVLRFMGADVVTTIGTEEGSSILPMVTVCNSSPLRCGCEVRFLCAAWPKLGTVLLLLSERL